jgi:serpin B
VDLDKNGGWNRRRVDERQMDGGFTMRKIATIVTMALIMASCSTTDSAGPEPPPGLGSLRSDVAFTAEAPPSDLDALARADLAFTVDLLREVSKGDNVFLSPLSITTALGMLEAGARGETLEEIAAALHETLSGQALHDARGSALAALEAAAELPPEVEGEPFTIRSVNSLWLQQDYPVRDTYLDRLAASYDAGLFLVDYVGDAEGARVAINDWVEEQTEDRIEDLIPKGVLGALTRLVLTNAVYFKASWMEPFQEEATQDGPFTLTDGTQADVPLMRNSGSFAYYSNDEFEAVWLPYWGGTSMMLLLPAENPQDLLASLSADDLVAAVEQRTQESFAELVLPKFELEAELSLMTTLKALGIEQAFNPPPGAGTADFTGITEQPDLFVSEVLHKAFVAVDEEGTEAAAATAIVMRATAAPIGQELTLRFDRPFVLLIQDDTTGQPIFAGVIEDPA